MVRSMIVAVLVAFLLPSLGPVPAAAVPLSDETVGKLSRDVVVGTPTQASAALDWLVNALPRAPS